MRGAGISSPGRTKTRSAGVAISRGWCCRGCGMWDEMVLSQRRNAMGNSHARPIHQIDDQISMEPIADKKVQDKQKRIKR